MQRVGSLLGCLVPRREQPCAISQGAGEPGQKDRGWLGEALQGKKNLGKT